MTFLEKALEFEYANNSTEVSVYEIMKNSCPSEYGLSEDTKCEERGESTEHDCVKCWNREMPNTEPKADGIPVIPQREVDAYNKGHADGVAQGMNDAWELAKRILGIIDKENHELIPAKELIKIYGSNDLLDIFAFIPQEALAKLKAYEDSKIEVGDVVAWTDFADDTFNGVVLDFKDNTDNEVVVFTENSCVDVWKIAECKKTGKHIDISSILEQIGE